MKKYITVFVLLFFAFGFSQKQEPVYILFNQNETATCQFPVKRIAPVKKIKLDYSQKRHRKINITRFILCRNIFVFEFKKNHFETVDGSAVANYKMITLDEMISKEEESEFKKDINQLFPKIYIIEAIENGQYAKYEVVWEKLQ
ncbi:hypothetical protein M0M57_07045 [Flavobacterium azooxidireducens]|uniref:Uncharacterized protein n=1 Tax=Flavobacterium azooxidireducens TaxID=1871076 RepID=A0ABY4KLM4_9FLAO|nr:hypothetical protein [Flavobacterium azooxidireducens]UPQ80588.1 hypothetical protein M0M57_07045 [Flavobacterium azooxidireducens]